MSQIITETVVAAGVSNFLRLAEAAGWPTAFPGREVTIQEELRATAQEHADLDAASYRLTPETSERQPGEFAERASALKESGICLALGGTHPVAARAKFMQRFEWEPA